MKAHKHTHTHIVYPLGNEPKLKKKNENILTEIPTVRRQIIIHVNNSNNLILNEYENMKSVR